MVKIHTQPEWNKAFTKIRKDLKKQLIHYSKLVKAAEKHGIENMNFSETEDYGAYLGKKELLELLIIKLDELAS